jgi:hypothetical protein
MKRQPLDDGGWIDLDTATEYEEGVRWDGSNHVSLATGSKFEHERLFRTAKGSWIKHSWSQWQGSTPSWERISAETAARWLVLCEHDSPEALPELAEHVSAMEL